MVWRAEDPQGNESGKVKYDIVRYTRGRGLDLGCGPNKAWPHFIGVDSGKDAELFGIQMRPDLYVDDCANLSMFAAESMDFVFSSHLLEHIEDYQSALKEWWRVIKVGGYLCLYLPHKDLYPNIGTEGANPDHKHDFLPDQVTSALFGVAQPHDVWCEVDETRDAGMEYSFLQVYRKGETSAMPKLLRPRPRPAKTVCVVRFGAFGDMIQAANILPELKRQGYHVTVMTTPAGKQIIAEDPHVDEWFLMDRNQVPNHELVDFWTATAKRYDKWVQLSESIEGALLAMPGRPNHAWPRDVRARYLNKNYLEWTSELAGLPYKSEGVFYPTATETTRAQETLRTLGGDEASPYYIMWALAGSSVHKVYPHMDAVIARVLLDMPSARIILTGDVSCQLLEQGWENEPRILCLSGRIPIRETLALARLCHMVIGPETGVLNAVAFERHVAKVVFLSHSSPENLTKHWLKALPLQAKPDDTVRPCGLRPCHQLHYTREHCPEHTESGASMCQAAIPPAQVFEAIQTFARRALRRAA